MSIECYLNDPKWNQCCCACEYHLPLYSHPLVDGKSILNNIGYVCIYEVDDKRATLCREHGLCECYEKEKDLCQ